MSNQRNVTNAMAPPFPWVGPSVLMANLAVRETKCLEVLHVHHAVQRAERRRSSGETGPFEKQDGSSGRLDASSSRFTGCHT